MGRARARKRVVALLSKEAAAVVVKVVARSVHQRKRKQPKPMVVVAKAVVAANPKANAVATREVVVAAILQARKTKLGKETGCVGRTALSVCNGVHGRGC